MELLKVIIVDDDCLVVDDLCQLIDWKQCGMEIVGTANNGKKGLALVEQLHPQIAIVDITMPVLSGLDFCRQISERQIPLQVLLLTAYRDFEYAKAAVPLGIFDYVLKNDINELSLRDIMERMKEKLSEDSKHQTMKKSQILEQLLLGGEPEASVPAATLSEFALTTRQPARLLLLNADAPYKTDHSADFTQKQFSMAQFVDKHPCPACASYLTELPCVGVAPTTAVLFLKTQAAYQTREEYCHLMEMVRYYQASFLQDCGQTLSAVFSDQLWQLSEIPQTFQRLCHAVRYSFFAGTGAVLGLSEMEKHIAEEEEGYSLSELEKLIARGSYHQAAEEIAGLLDRFGTQHWNRKAFADICTHGYIFINRYREQLPCYSQGNTPLEIDRYCCKDVAEAKRCFERDILQLAEAVVPPYSAKVRRAINFIHANYEKNITLKDVAKELAISDIYLSRLFRKETKNTFLDYLTAHRMNVAKSMLESGDYRVGEISEAVGYKTSQYFSVLFRKMFGHSPSECAKHAEQEETEGEKK
ncbi:MAG: response regulator [Angelakisella sp.]